MSLADSDGASANGISIPSSYTAHLAPLSSSKLYNEARVGKDTKSLETPYVVMFQAVNILSGDAVQNGRRCGPQVQECWEFEHPRRDDIVDARGFYFLVFIAFGLILTWPSVPRLAFDKQS
jgi:type II protein arginine methyltransferase